MSYVAKSRSPLRRIAPMGMGSNQSMPQTGRVVARVLGGLGATAMEYVVKPVILPVPPVRPVSNRRPAANVQRVGGGSNYNAWTGLGSLGDDAAPADPSIGADPVVLAQQQLTELKKISASQAEFVQREMKQRWIQIGATVSIPLFAAIWRAIFRGGRRAGSDIGA